MTRQLQLESLLLDQLPSRQYPLDLQDIRRTVLPVDLGYHQRILIRGNLVDSVLEKASILTL